MKAFGAEGCCLVGHRQYYPKFGFENISGLILEDVPPEAFFVLSFNGHFPHGMVTFHKSFQADSQPRK